jgi:hypothetical protein
MDLGDANFFLCLLVRAYVGEGLRIIGAITKKRIKNYFIKMLYGHMYQQTTGLDSRGHICLILTGKAEK